MNEWGFAGEIKSWWDAVIGIRPDLGLGRVTIEESPEGEQQRADLTLYDDLGHRLMVLELRLPDHPDASPAAIGNINNAMEKASAVAARWSATSDGETFLLLDHSRHDVPTRERAVPVARLSHGATRRSLDVPASFERVRAAWEDLLLRLGPVLTGQESAPRTPPDEFFVESLRASLARPLAETRDEISRRQAGSPDFSEDLVRWMVDEQGWLHDPKDFQEEIERVAQVVTYVFATRLLFYGALRRAQPTMPELEMPASGNPGLTQLALEHLFEEARRVTGDYETVFVFDDVCRWALISEASCRGWIRVLDLLAHFELETISYDVLGRLFERLIDPHERYEWGQHYTSPDVVDLMLSAALPSGTGTVYDPASGGGTFLVRAYARKRVGEPEGTHNYRLREIAGGDISAFAASVSTISLASQSLDTGSNYPQVRVGSFFRVEPGEPFVTLPGDDGEMEDRVLPAIDAIVCNPPYIGFSKIGWRLAEAAASYLKGWPQRPALKHRYNYHLFFWFHAARFLSERGRMAFITSGEWLDSDYGVQLQDWLTSTFQVELVIESMAEQWFGEARVGTVVVVVRKLAPGERPEDDTRFVTLRRTLAELYGVTTAGDAERLTGVDAFRDRLLSLTNTGESAGLDHYSIPQADLRAAGLDGDGRYVGATWRSRFLRSPKIAHALEARPDYAPVGELATVQLGAKTGADNFFFLKVLKRGAKWQVRGLKGKWAGEIGSGHLKPALQNPKDLDRGGGRYLVPHARSLPGAYFAPGRVVRDTGVRDYIRAGEDAGIHRLTLVEQNKDGVWYRQGRTVVTADWALPYNSAYDYFAVDNRAARAVLNGRFVGVDPKNGVDSELLGAVLNSTFAIVARLLEGVTTGNEGAYDVGPPAVRLMRVPDPRKFSVEGATRVRAAFEEVREKNFIPGAPDRAGGVDPLRRELDTAILLALGDTPGETAVLLDRLYGSYARWRRAVEDVEDQVQHNRRALGARGGARTEDPVVRAARTVYDEIHGDVALSLTQLSEIDDVEYLDVVAAAPDHQDALIDLTTLRTKDGSVVDVGSKHRVEFVGLMRELGWVGPIPVPSTKLTARLNAEANSSRQQLRSAAAQRATAYVSDRQASDVVDLVEKLWARSELAQLRASLGSDVSHSELAADHPGDASLFETDGLVPPAPRDART